MSLLACQPRDWAVHPACVVPGYRSTELRAPTRHLLRLRPSLSELTGPVYGASSVGPLDHDLTRNGRLNGEPLRVRSWWRAALSTSTAGCCRTSSWSYSRPTRWGATSTTSTSTRRRSTPISSVAAGC